MLLLIERERERERERYKKCVHINGQRDRFLYGHSGQVQQRKESRDMVRKACENFPWSNAKAGLGSRLVLMRDK